MQKDSNDDYIVLFSKNPNLDEKQYNNRIELIFEKNDGYKHIGRSNSFTQIVEIRDYVH